MGGKASEDDAGVVRADQLCGGCSQWTRETGDCAKVEGSFGAGDGCRKYFMAIGGAAMPGQQVEPDQDDAMMAMGNSGRP